MKILQKIKNIFHKKPKIVVVLGQTSTGKSDIAVEIAQKYDGEIVSADSRQVYRGMDLGSGKITKAEMQGIPHHLLDVAEPNEIFDVIQFQKLGTQALNDILTRKKTPIICGGTGFYIDALVYQTQFNSVKPNKELREKLGKLSLNELQEMYLSLRVQDGFSVYKKKLLVTKQSPVLLNYMKKIYLSIIKKYPRSRRKLAMTNKIDMQNPVRIIRALEIINELGYIPKVKKKNPYKVLFIGMTLQKDELDKRIYKRIIDRLEKGMLEEVKTLLQNGVSHERLQSLGLEYRFMSKFILGEITREEMIDQLYRATVQFAKRQKTWFKRNKNIHWFNYFDNRKAMFDLVNVFLIK